MDITSEYLFITPDDLEAGAQADSQREWNVACTTQNFVLHHEE
ncbi:MAG: hypothetical protein U5K77_03615 [Candidatus Saccharibacteria bacterium]|nr:hypothetical protein [Candidatus Saccharibacteria bacterium]